MRWWLYAGEMSGTDRFEIGDALARGVPGLRAQEALFLEYEATAYEDTADNGEDDADDLGRGEGGWCKGGETRP